MPTKATSRAADLPRRCHTCRRDRPHAWPAHRARGRADGCLEGSAEEAELAMLTDVIEAYARQRSPDGRISRRQGLTSRVQFVLAERKAGRSGSVLPRLAQPR
jgi:hypothetical protein